MTWTTEKSGNAISEKKLKAVEKEDYSKKQKEWYENYQHLQTTKKERSHSRLVLGIWGDPKNGKTGLALDFPDDKIYSNVNALRSKGRVWKFEGNIADNKGQIIAESNWCATIMDKKK